MNFDIEKQYFYKGFTVVCGTDEAGRGPLAGPVCAAACILPPELYVKEINDSKKLSERKRELLFDYITENAVSYAIEFSPPCEIDEINILNASQAAMRRAVMRLSPVPELVLVDGNIARDFKISAVPIVGGDALSPSIAAASILAKVSRDRLMKMFDLIYPGYGFARHKGYPTKEHMEAVRRLGASPIHRLSFLGFLNK